MFSYFGDSFDDRADFDDMWVSGSYGSIDSVPLDPIFTWGDDRYFNVLNNSNTGSWLLDKLHDGYYAVQMNEDGNRLVSLDWAAGSEFNLSEPVVEQDNSGDSTSNDDNNDDNNSEENNAGIDDSVVEGGSCTPGNTKAPDSADCRYCVCQGDSTWKCDSSSCNTKDTQSENTAAGGIGTTSVVMISLAVVVGILIVFLLIRQREAGLDPWMQEPEDLKESVIPELPPLDAAPPADKKSET